MASAGPAEQVLVTEMAESAPDRRLTEATFAALVTDWSAVPVLTPWVLTSIAPTLITVGTDAPTTDAANGPPPDEGRVTVGTAARVTNPVDRRPKAPPPTVSMVANAGVTTPRIATNVLAITIDKPNARRLALYAAFRPGA
jgi:hypothetical protein